MAFNVVTFKQYPDAEEQFAVFHSTSETMFSETFGHEHELEAYLFAAFYNNHRGIPKLFLEAEQREVSADIHIWLDEKAPHPIRKGRETFYGRTIDEEDMTERNLPQAWIEALNPPDDEDDDVCAALERDAKSDPRYTLDQLTEDFRNGESKVDFIIDEFSAWYTAKHATAK